VADLSKGQDQAAIEASRARAKKRRPLERERLKANKARRAQYVASKKAAALVASEGKPDIGVRDRWLEQKATQPQPKANALWPQSLDALAARTAPYGETVAKYAQSEAVRRWACDSIKAPGNVRSNPEPVVSISLDHYRTQIWRDIGVKGPMLPAGGYARALDDLSPDSRFEAMLVVNDTIAEWEAAGSPGLDQPTLWVAYRYLVGNVWAGELEPFEGCPPKPDKI